MNIKDIKYIPRIQDFQLIAGANGTSRDIRNVVIFEYEDEKKYEEDYYHHDFIITSLIFAKSNPALIEPMLEKMMELGASGIAIKRAYYQELPANVIALANKNDMPLFVFDGIFIEDVIVSIAGYMQNENRFSIYQQEISELIQENRSSFEMERYCRMMNHSFQGYMAAVYIECANGDNRAIEQILHALLMRQPIAAKKDYQFFQYHNGLFVLYNCTTSLSASLCQQRLISMIEQFGCRFVDYCGGFSSCIDSPQLFDRCFSESYFSFCYARNRKLSQSFYSEIGIYQLLFPLLMHKISQSKYNQLLTLLRQTDIDGKCEFLNTLITYCACDFHILHTAEQLCQHPNTIRYRLKRCYDLLHCSSQMELYFNCILLSSYHIFSDML